METKQAEEKSFCRSSPGKQRQEGGSGVAGCASDARDARAPRLSGKPSPKMLWFPSVGQAPTYLWFPEKNLPFFLKNPVLLEFLTSVHLSEILALQTVQAGAPALSSERLQLREVSCSTFNSWYRNHCPNTAPKRCRLCGDFTWLCTNETRKRKTLCKTAVMVKKGNGLLHVYFCPK